MFLTNGYKLGAIVSFAAGLLAMVPATARPDQVKLTTSLGTPVVMADRVEKAFVKVGIVGSSPAARAKRPPLNLAIVLDRSGSMSGEKIEKARDAAIMMVQRLDAGDIVSVVVFDHTVQVLVPATRLADRTAVLNAIRSIEPGGNTALFGGVSKGAAEVRKFKEKTGVNRVILLSDGQANSGPSTPQELGDLGAALKKEGISVTTIGLGLGYNEDLMSQLAGKSDGNHAFVARATDLARIFDLELGDLVSVVARDVDLKVECQPGVRPVRVLGREATIDGQSAYATIAQLYASQEASMILEVELSPGRAGTSREVARVSAGYTSVESNAGRALKGSATVRFTASESEAASSTDARVMTSAVELVATEVNKLAVTLRDQGKVEEARAALQQNAAYLLDNSRRYNSTALKDYSAVQSFDASNLDPASWAAQRKSMRKWQQNNRAAAAR
ncbi:MAG: VWA domain-containing protein [Candidatus Riflebacteria bacterium]|nr:VWA domain-containing protein [Candidatus Riflebacteria bacterium]